MNSAGRARIPGMVRAILAAVIVGAVLGVIVGAVAVAVVRLAECTVDTFGPETVLLCPGRDAFRVWPWPPGGTYERDRAPSRLAAVQATVQSAAGPQL